MLGAIIAFLTGGSIIKDELKGWNKDIDSKSRAAADEKSFGTYYDHKGRQRWIEDDRLVHVGFNSKGDLCVTDLRNGQVLRNISEEKRRKAEEEKKKQIQKEIENYDEYHTVYLVKKGNNELDLKKSLNEELACFNECIYQDIKTNKRYVVREFGKERLRHYNKTDGTLVKILGYNQAEEIHRLVYYMDMETGLLVRLADSYNRQCKKMKETAKRRKSEPQYMRAWERMQEDLAASDMVMEKFNKFQNARRSEIDFSDWKEWRDFYGRPEDNTLDNETDTERSL